MHAAIAISPSSATATPYVSTSIASTPNSNERIASVTARAPSTPATAPTATGRNPCPMTRRNSADGRAPSASRIRARANVARRSTRARRRCRAPRETAPRLRTPTAVSSGNGDRHRPVDDGLQRRDRRQREVLVDGLHLLSRDGYGGLCVRRRSHDERERVLHRAEQCSGTPGAAPACPSRLASRPRRRRPPQSTDCCPEAGRT